MSRRLALSALLAIPTPMSAYADTAFNDAVLRYEINMKNVEVQVTGAATQAQLGQHAAACAALEEAIKSYDYALDSLDMAEKSPLDPADKPRPTRDQFEGARQDIRDKKAMFAPIVEESCNRAKLK